MNKKKQFLLNSSLCLITCLYSGMTIYAQELTAGEKMNQLLTEMIQARDAGDKVRVEEIGREMQSLTSRVKEEQKARITHPKNASGVSASEKLKSMAAQLKAYSDTPEYKISIAARKGDVAKVKKLYESGAKINFYRLDPAPPLMEAAANGQVKVAKYLLSVGALLRVKNSFITLDTLRLAAEAKEDNSEMLMLLIDNGALTNGDVENMGSAVVKNSEAQGKKHKGVDGRQMTSGSALMAAIQKGRVKHVKTLLEHGANANDWAFGKSALMLASKKLNLDMINLLLKHEADVSLIGPEHKTALQFANKIKETRENSSKRTAVIERLSNL